MKVHGAALALLGVTALFAAAPALGGSSDSDRLVSYCETTWDSAQGAHFDLSALVRAPDEPSYRVVDGDIECTSEVEKNYSYTFNICNQITQSSVPEACRTEGEVGPAFQSNADANPECHSLGATGEWALLDPSDPSKGVSLQYINGQPCNHPQPNPPSRTVTLNFPCSNTAIPAPTTANEPSHCQYMVEMPTYYGCPTECPIAGRALCNGKGICGYDKTKLEARCFCDEGFGGADCTQDVDAAGDGNGAVVGLLVTVLLIALALLGALIWTVRMLRAYHKQQENYMQLQNVGANDDV